MTIEFYEKPIAVVDFEIHCAKRRKYPVLLQIEYNSAIKERENHAARVGNRRSNHERNQNPKIFPCEFL